MRSYAILSLALGLDVASGFVPAGRPSLVRRAPFTMSAATTEETEVVAKKDSAAPPSPSLPNIKADPKKSTWAGPSPADEAQIDATTRRWISTVTSGNQEAAAATAALYAEDGVIHPTVSKHLRTSTGIKNYMDFFANLPGLRVIDGTYKNAVRFMGPDFAIASGFYTFEYENLSVPGATNVVPARFTFSYRRNPNNPVVEWEIVDHHSSKIPEAPGPLEDDVPSVVNAVGTAMDKARPTWIEGDFEDAFASPESSTQTAKKAAVDAITRRWCATVTSHTPDAATRTAALYAKDGVIHPTVSTHLRTGAGIKHYMDFFSGLPGLRVVEGSYTNAVRILDDNVAISSGFYTFEYGETGAKNIVPARYTFVYRRNPSNPVAEWEIVEHHSSKLPEAPEPLDDETPVMINAVGASTSAAGSKRPRWFGEAEIAATGSPKVTKQDFAAVDATTKLWCNTVTSHTHDAAARTAALYAADGVIHPTVSKHLRTSTGIKNYMDFFTNLPGLRVMEGTLKNAVRFISDDIAIASGFYTFEYGAEYPKNIVPARFTFVYRKDPANPVNQWEIVEHHSSKLPVPPDALDDSSAAVNGVGSGSVTHNWFDEVEEEVPGGFFGFFKRK